MDFKIGDRVTYTGRHTWGEPREGCIIESLEEAGSFFNTQMASITGVGYWVATNELEKEEDKLDKAEIIRRVKEAKDSEFSDRTWNLLNDLVHDLENEEKKRR